jgi:hypothetical protein
MPAIATGARVIAFALSILIAFASWRFMIGGVALTMEHVAYHADLRPIAFFAHVGLAPVALVLTPFQMWAGLRARRPALHRWMGRACAGAIVLSGLGGLVMAFGTTAGPVAALGFGVLAVIWLGCLGMGVAHAIGGRIALHRRWMIRTAAMTFAAVTLRVQIPLALNVLGLPFEDAYPVIAWAAWVPNLLIAEWVLRRA